jgi:hypothetical protein
MIAAIFAVATCAGIVRAGPPIPPEAGGLRGVLRGESLEHGLYDLSQFPLGHVKSSFCCFFFYFLLQDKISGVAKTAFVKWTKILFPFLRK